MQVLSSRRAKAASKFVALLLEDRFLLRALIEQESLHTGSHIGLAIECIFHAEGHDVDLIRLAMPKAVESTPEPELLFRQDSVFTDIAGRFMRLHGAKYLRKALKSPLAGVLQRAKAGEEFGIEAARSNAASVERVLHATEEVLRNVLAKAVTMPSEIRTAIAALTDATEAKFGSTKRSLALLGLFWLRFVCPAIVDPFQTGVLKRTSPMPGPDARQALLSLSKCVKACVDGQTPENFSPAAALQLKELSAKWRPRIDACFLELRQPAPRTAPQRGERDDGIMAAVSVLETLRRQKSALSSALASYGATGTIRAVEEILEQMEGRKKGSAVARAESAVESWTHEQVLAWLDMLGLPQHKAAMASRGVTGKTLVTLDASALVLMGIEQEEEQWAILQSVRDHVSLMRRYRVASASAARRGGPVLPSLDAPLEECDSASFDDSSFNDESSSNSNSSAGSASLVPRRGSNIALHQEPVRRSSAPAIAAAPADQLPLNCLFKISRGNAGIRIVRAKRTDPLRALQASIERECCVPCADQTLSFVDADQKRVTLASDSDLQHFFATQGTVTKNDLGSTAVYRLYLS